MARQAVAKRPRKTRHPAISQARHDKIVELLSKGWTADEVAAQIARKSQGNSVRNFTRIQGQVRRVAAQSEELQLAAQEVIAGTAYERAQDIASALARRAERGRVDAAKFLFEMAGLYSPKSSVEHSGGIELKITAVPRPSPVDNTPQRPQLDEPIVDAEVVDED